MKLLPLLFPVKLNVNISAATTSFDAAAVILGKTNDFARVLKKLWTCLNEWELVGLIKVQAGNTASPGQLEREKSNKLQTEHEPALLFWSDDCTVNSDPSVHKSTLYMKPLEIYEIYDNLTSICWLQAVVQVL